MKVNCIIVDDEPVACDLLEKYVRDVPALDLVKVCSNALEATEVLMHYEVHLIFLDINMPRLSGMKFYRSLASPPSVIFTTAYPEYALEGFEVDAVDYLLKPFSFERFYQAVLRVLERLKPEQLKPEDDFILARGNISMRLRVAGLFETGSAIDKSLVYIPLTTAQDLVGKGDVVSEVDVRIKDIYQAPYIVSDLNSRFRYQSKSWQDMNADILKLIQTQSIFSWIFYILIFVIAGFGIANTMIMIISRKTKEIGILMAMGATPGSIRKIFVLESLILAPPAALLGSLLAFLTAQLIMSYDIQVPSEIYMVSRMTITMNPEFFIYAIVFALAVNFVAGMYPAWKASRMDPVEAIGSI